MSTRALLCLNVMLTCWAAPAAAAPLDWSLALALDAQTGPAGSMLVFTGAIGNNTTGELFLDYAELELVAPPTNDYVLDYADEFLGTLGIIPMSGYSGPLFHVILGPSVSPGTRVTGRFALGASDVVPSALEVSFTASTAGDVSMVPEPATVTTLLSGLGALAALRSRRRPAGRVS